MEDDDVQGALMGQEGADEQPAQQQHERPRAHDMNALGDFLALLARQRLGLRRVRRLEDEAPPSHESLLATLKEQQLISSPRLLHAMQLVKRGDFVPSAHQREAFLDSPIRIYEHEFNVSAPHIHSRALDALDLQAGDSFLDVGSGTGLMAVYASVLVGKSGSVLSIDVKAVCTSLSSGFLRRFAERCEEYRQGACEVRFEQGDIFFPLPEYKERFDKVYVGAGCPSDRLLYFGRMLKRGGSMVVPSGSELLFIKKKHDGGFTRTCLSSVSFTSLCIPSDDAIISALLEQEARRIRHIPVPPSTLQADLDAALLPAAPTVKHPNSPNYTPSIQSGRKAECLSESTPLKRHKSEVYLFTPLAPNPCRKGFVNAWLLSIAALKLGKPDYTLVHQDVHYPAHRLLLKARCKCFEALFSSGMRDSCTGTFVIQDSFSTSSLTTFLQWAYTDHLELNGTDTHGEVKEMVDLACFATYFGAVRLSTLCETRLVRLLNEASEPYNHKLSLDLLKVSSSLGLRGLEANVCEFIVDHHEAVDGSEGWDELDKEEVMSINKTFSRRLQSMRAAMRTAAEMKQEMPAIEGEGEEEV
jgi:protein-L-isoaspartate(D-aspartate) O-methyltransferase